MDEYEQVSVGDQITWWADSHDRGLAPEEPGAREHEGTVAAVNRGPYGKGPVVALIVDCHGLFGVYQSVVRPDYGHRPQRVT